MKESDMVSAGTSIFDVSVVVPLYNEEENVERLWNSISSVMDDSGINYEVVFVDDGSKDRTFAIARGLAERFPRLKVVKFRGNYGQTPAMVAGIEQAKGRVLVTMDGDLQNDPRDIPSFLAKLDDGFDIVVGWRHKRQDKLVSRKIPSVIANWIIGKVTGVPIKDNGCSLKAYRAEIIKNVPLYSEMHRFIPAMTSLSAAKVAEIKVRHHARQFGESKYGLSRIYKVVLDLIAVKTIIHFRGKPARWFATLASPFVILSILLFPIAVYHALAGAAGQASVLAGVCLILGATGTFLVVLGVLGELVYRTGSTKFERWASLTARQSGNEC
ncbi:MAG: glycosyltransferase family 2 protein [Pseudomonadota bacterium]